MATHNVHIPDDLLNAVIVAAQAEGRTPEELLAHAVGQYLAHRDLDDLVARGRAYSRHLNRKPSDVLRLIQESRNEQLGR